MTIMRGKIENVAGGISGGPGDFYLKSANYELGGQSISDGDVKEVDPEESQQLRVDWVIGNRDPGWVFPQWDGRATVYDLTHGKKVGTERSDADGAEGRGSESLDLGAITEPTTFRINILANQDYRASEPALSLWKSKV